jgi:ATP-dependent DNA helicase RecQ
MLAAADDVVTLENFSCGDTPSRESVAAIISELLSAGDQFSVAAYDLGARHDVRELVVKTLLTYLELDGYLESTGPYYSEYRIQPRRSSREILQKFDGERRKFLEALFQQAKKGRTWFTIDAEQAATRLNQPRQRIVNAIDYLEQQDALVVQATGVRLGFRRVRKPSNERELVETLVERFNQREEQDVARVAQVVSFAEHPGCLTGYLLDYFGEMRDRCGHCDRCQGVETASLPRAANRALGRADAQAIHQLCSERHTSLVAPRQMTRFLCGIASPATTKAKLRQHNQFGRLEGVPFRQVLEYVEERMAVDNPDVV